MRKKTIIVAIIVTYFMLPFLIRYAAAQPYYEGEILKLIVATEPGGGYDFYARLMAKSMQKYLPGSKIIIRYIPGAGNIIGCNATYISKPDGLTFGTFNRALPIAQVVGLKGIKFDLSKMSWLGSPSTEIYSFIVSTKSPYRNLDDVMKADKVLLASSGIGTIDHAAPLLFAEMTGLNNFKMLTGYAARGETMMAMMQGDIQGSFGSWESFRQFCEEGNAVPIMFIAKEPVKGYEQIPLIQNVVKAEEYKPVVDLMIAINFLGRPFAGPPNIPVDRLKMLQDAFEKACSDPELLKVAAKAGKPIDYVSGNEAKQMVKDILKLPPKILNLLKSAYGVK